MRIKASWVAALSDEDRRRQIARCDDEIQRLESRPDDVDEPAYLVTIGIEDWRAERRLLEAAGRKLTYGSLFTGIGGIDLGLDRAGFQCRWQVENEPYAVKILEKRWPEVKRHGDITKLDAGELEPVDLICGGFPCQDLSQAGKQTGFFDPAGAPTRSGLWFEYARLVRGLRPRWVLIENVPGLLVSDAMRRVVGELARLGYVGCYRSLRASEFGASHLRKRVFIVAYSECVRCERSEGLSAQREENPADRFGLWDGPEGRGQYLAHSECAERRTDDEHQQLRAARGEAPDRPGSDCGHVGDPDRGQREQRGRAVEAERNLPGPDGGCDPLEDANALQREQPARQRTGSSDTGRTGACDQPARPDIGLADPGNRLLPQQGRGPEGRDGTGSAGEILPDFAPGPSDPRWPAILRERPDLAPALESQICGVADGVSDWMDRAMSNRTKRLGRLGNAVVPQIAEWIGLRILALHNADRS